MKPIIFSKPDDLPGARKCRTHLRKEFGLRAVIESGLPTNKRLYGLMGAETANEMLDAMLALSNRDDEVVVRIDSDTVLLDNGYQWLASATTESGRGYITGIRRKICVTFSCTIAHLKRAKKLLRTAQGDGCSGCLINHALLRTGGFERTKGLWVYGSMDNHPVPPDAHFVTLPSRPLESIRKQQMTELWKGVEDRRRPESSQ